MSGADVTLLLNTQYGNLSKLLASDQTLWSNRGYDTTNIFAVDNTQNTTPVGTQATFGGQDRFRFRKRGGRAHKAWLKVTVNAGVATNGTTSAWVDDFASALIQDLQVQYASKILHEYNGETIKMYNRLMYHDITRECYNAMALAGLPPGGGGEQQRISNTTNAFVAYVPLSWLWFVRSEDYALTPEALASELDLIVNYQQLGFLCYSRNNTTPFAVPATPFTTLPAIALSQLYTQLVFTPTPEKNLNLATFESRQGNIYKILDIEPQVAVPIAAQTASAVQTYNLDNFRLDSHFIIFMVRDSNILNQFQLDRMQTDSTPSILPGNPNTSALRPIQRFRILANGRTVVDYCTDVENRCVWRDIYFPGSQIAEPIYFVPWAWLLRDHKNVTGFQNMANLGNVQLEITFPNVVSAMFPSSSTTGISGGAAANSMILDVYNVVHNIVQMKKGDIIKALR